MTFSQYKQTYRGKFSLFPDANKENVWSPCCQIFQSVHSLFFLNKVIFLSLSFPRAGKRNCRSLTEPTLTTVILIQGHRSTPLTSDVSRVTVNSLSVRRMRERECTAARSRSRAPSSYILAVRGSSASRGSQWERSLSLSRWTEVSHGVFVVGIFRVFSV